MQPPPIVSPPHVQAAVQAIQALQRLIPHSHDEAAEAERYLQLEREEEEQLLHQWMQQ